MKTAKFRFCGYWRTWSRLLATNHPCGSSIELNLTPINIRTASRAQWQDEVGQIVIRAHNTKAGRDDIETDELPADIKAKMVAQLGEPLVERLLNEDFFGQADWEKYAALDQLGGTPFHLIAKAA